MQPIDTAPRDGTEILIRDESMVYHHVYWGMSTPEHMAWVKKTGGFCPSHNRPTHWVSLSKVESDWISVDDALPQHPGRYLVWTPHGWPAFAYWQPAIPSRWDGHWTDGPGLAAFVFQYGVTHWRESPDGPQASQRTAQPGLEAVIEFPCDSRRDADRD